MEKSIDCQKRVFSFFEEDILIIYQIWYFFFFFILPIDAKAR